jgi:DNA-binding transcriptional MerR regulator
MLIGEVAERTSLTVDAIRFYEIHSLLPKAERTVGRFRLYTKDSLDRLCFIRQMQKLGYKRLAAVQPARLVDRRSLRQQDTATTRRDRKSDHHGSAGRFRHLCRCDPRGPTPTASKALGSTGGTSWV